jgi:hypothetical protein
MKIPTVFAIAIGALISGPATAVYKCAAQGEIVYQDRPCLAGTETVVSINVPHFGEPERAAVRTARAPTQPAPQDASAVEVPLLLSIPVQLKK